jgi:hypothetical protein
MAVSVCPIATIAAPADQVWDALMSPNSWWDARLLSTDPPGPPHPGQVVRAVAGPGYRWPVSFRVEAVDRERRQLRLRSRLGLGLEGDHTLTCTAVGPEATRVSFG